MTLLLLRSGNIYAMLGITMRKTRKDIQDGPNNFYDSQYARSRKIYIEIFYNFGYWKYQIRSRSKIYVTSIKHYKTGLDTIKAADHFWNLIKDENWRPK